MQIGGGELSTNNPGSIQSRGGWELESAHFAAARAGLELATLRAASPGASDLDRAERRYRTALHLLNRIRSSLNDSSTAD